MQKAAEVLYFTKDDVPKLHTLLSQPEWEAFSELPENINAPVFPDLSTNHDFCLRVLSLTAYRMDVAEMVTRQITLRSGKSQEMQHTLHTILQEAIANALIHGNLHITGHRNTMAEMENFFQMVERCLKEEQFSVRPIDITADWKGRSELRLSVTDHGNGFDHVKFVNTDLLKTEVKPHGNGVRLIRACCERFAFENGGRTIVMEL